MDGSNAAFLFETPSLSTRSKPASDGILYIEDFDAGPFSDGDAVAAEPAPVSYTAEELAAAYTAGHEAGVIAATSDTRLAQSQLQLAAIQSLDDNLVMARGMLSDIASLAAEALSQTVLAVLQAAVPAAMRYCAHDELRTMIAGLTPGLRLEPELRVRVHRGQADYVRETLITALPIDTCVLSVCADETLQEGDVRVAWRDGRADRDCGAIWAEIVAALSPLKLPILEEICHGGGR